ncbi:MAG: hypothetical protein M1816_007815 [Peltula sp. TS41687]|nr:MAG: hypothetical protein M1816_007815 [Peltula sp. TS41687]
MELRSLNLHLLTSVLLFPLLSAAELPSTHTVTVYTWPLSVPSPTPYLEIKYDPTTLQTAVTKAYPPFAAGADANDDNDPLTRVGLWDQSSGRWRGVVTALSGFGEESTRTVSLHLDGKGDVWHVGFYAGKPVEDYVVGKTKGSGAAGQVRVELVRATPGPMPVLDEPMVLDESGRLPEKEVEKSFFQRYWWVFMAIAMLAMLGSGEQ